MRAIIAKLPIIRETPRERARHVHTIFPYRLEHFGHVGEVVDGAGRVVQLVAQVGFVGLGEDGEAEFRYYDWGVERVVEVGEVQAQVGGRNVDVGFGAVADIPARGGCCTLIDAVWEICVGGVGGAFEDRVGGVHDWWGDYGCLLIIVSLQ